MCQHSRATRRTHAVRTLVCLHCGTLWTSDFHHAQKRKLLRHLDTVRHKKRRTDGNISIINEGGEGERGRVLPHANESFHAKLWQRANKTKFAGRRRVLFITQTTILDHNFGYKKASLLPLIGVANEGHSKSLELQDMRREKKSLQKKIFPERKKLLKKKDKEYEAGAF